MQQGPPQQFRDWLERQPQRAGQVPLQNLLSTWGSHDRARIQSELRGAGISAQPPLEYLGPADSTTLWLTGPAGSGEGAAAPANPVGLALIAAGALIGVISLFLDWTAGFSLWQIYTILDVATVLAGIATVGLCVFGLVARRSPYVRVALVPLAMFFALPALVNAVEFVVDPGPVEVGQVVGILSGLVASAGLAVLVGFDMAGGRRGPASGRAAVLIGVPAAAFVALLVTVTQLLPAVEPVPGEGGVSVSEWQVASVTDWFDQVLVVALIALAVVTAINRRVPALSLALGVLLAYFALPDLLAGLDNMVNGGTFFVANFLSVVSGAVALGASLLLLTNAYVGGE